VYTSAVTLIIKLTESAVRNAEKCYFLMPLQVNVPQFGALVVSRFLMAWKIRNGCDDSSAVMDYYGIYKEMIAANISALTVIPAYLAYAHACMSGKVRETFPAEFVLIIFPCMGGLIFLIVPGINFIFVKYQHSCCKRQKTVPVHAQIFSPDHEDLEDWDSQINENEMLDLQLSSSLDQSFLPRKRIVSYILHDKYESKHFRKHAQKSLCAENVDFYLEILSINKMGQTFGMRPAEPPTAHQTSLLHEKFCSMCNEFVADGAPSEVNLSCEHKRAILLYNCEKTFLSLDLNEILMIFEETKSELEKIMATNLLRTYLQFRETTGRLRTMRRVAVISDEGSSQIGL